MYKITLYDECCNPICDGTHFFFVENLEDFEKNWLPLEAIHGTGRINRYFQSKFGDIVTDYYSDSPELNIVQAVDFEELEKLNYKCTDINVSLENTYRCTTQFNFDTLEFKLIKAKIKDKYFLLGQYKGTGGKRIVNDCNRRDNTNTMYSQMHFYGNPIANYRYGTLETFVWLPIEAVSKDYRLKQLNSEQVGILMRDIVGEAG